MAKLRQKMIRAMELNNLSNNTQIQHQADNQKTSPSPSHARNLEDHLFHEQPQTSSYPDGHLLGRAQSQ